MLKMQDFYSQEINSSFRRCQTYLVTQWKYLDVALSNELGTRVQLLADLSWQIILSARVTAKQDLIYKAVVPISCGDSLSATSGFSRPLENILALKPKLLDPKWDKKVEKLGKQCITI